MPTSSSERIAAGLIAAALAFAPWPAGAGLPGDAVPPARTAGAIVAIDSYRPLYTGARASKPGDVLTIILAERTAARSGSSTSTDRGGNIGLTPPTAGPLSLFTPADINSGGTQSFKGTGETAQTNQLSGEITVTVTSVLPNGTLIVEGEKQLRLNRGDEAIRISGRVRPEDISADNRLLSTRLADARIRYTGKGEVARASKQGWLQRFFSRISPF